MLASSNMETSTSSICTSGFSVNSYKNIEAIMQATSKGEVRNSFCVVYFYLTIFVSMVILIMIYKSIFSILQTYLVIVTAYPNGYLLSIGSDNQTRISIEKIFKFESGLEEAILCT